MDAGHAAAPRPARRGRAGRRLRRDPDRRHPRPPPVRELRRVDRAVHRPGRRRPRGPHDQDDALPDVGRLADRPRPDPGRRAGQAGRRPRRDQGPLRRGGEHRLGPQAGAGRRPRRLRARRAQDPLEGRPRRPARGLRAPPLRPHRDRQLQPEDRPPVHGPRPAVVPAGARRRRHGPVQRPDRPVAPARRSAGCSSRRTASARRFLELVEREIGHAAVGHDARIVLKLNAIVDERVDRGALPRLAGRRRGRPHHPRRPARSGPASTGMSETDHGPLDRRRVPRALADLGLRERRRRPTGTSARPT